LCRSTGGKGYVDDLLAEGNATLHAAGAEYVRADTDAQNLPMAAAFRRAGYAEFAKRREYGVKLAPLEKSVG
jgi:RimJ/RimL family protein N-acetyltransferase